MEAGSDIARLRVLCVGSSSLMAFLTWRIRASNACECDLVWPVHHEAVTSFGFSLKSATFGSERFRPHAVFRTTQEAASVNEPYDYVICQTNQLDAANVCNSLTSVVTPSHTCIVVDTGDSLDAESEMAIQFPRNLVVTLVSDFDLAQKGPAEFEHDSSDADYDCTIGWVVANTHLPDEAQQDMVESLALALDAGQVPCRVSDNIARDKWRRLIGPLALYPLTVAMNEPDVSRITATKSGEALLQALVDEVVRVVDARFDFSRKNADSVFRRLLGRTKSSTNPLFKEYIARLPLSLDLYVHPLAKLAQEVQVDAPRVSTIHSIVEQLNKGERPLASAPSAAPSAAPGVFVEAASSPQNGTTNTSYDSLPYQTSRPGSYAPVGGASRGYLAGAGPGANGAPYRPNSNSSSSEMVGRMYNGGVYPGSNDAAGDLIGVPGAASPNAIDPRSVMYGVDRYGRPPGSQGGAPSIRGGVVGGPPPPRPTRSVSQYSIDQAAGYGGAPRPSGYRGPPRPQMRYGSAMEGYYDEYDDDDDDDYGMAAYQRGKKEGGRSSGRGGPAIDPEMVDMMSLTNRRTRKSTNLSNKMAMRSMLDDVEQTGSAPQVAGAYNRPGPNAIPGSPLARQRMRPPYANGAAAVALPNERITDHPMFSSTGSPYAMVDSSSGARTNSMTSQRMEDYGGVMRQGPMMMGHGSMPRNGPPLRAPASRSQLTSPSYTSLNHYGSSPLRDSGSGTTDEYGNTLPPPPPSKGTNPGLRSVTGSASASLNSGRNGESNGGGEGGSSSSSLDPHPGHHIASQGYYQ